ncbi:zinc finger MYM-type protein 1-like [Dreissena polymorpha]|uniref:zinc finger MYM-type protein 1-like n=1 Tax=Dreissena polymorpha TaxID=45954 RepID=UPI0022653F59|nr:zinc finger MYM-type protein 1-like [Dreissena polymorpha]
MADETTDAAAREKIALCLRFYDAEKKCLREEFVEFAEFMSTTGEALANTFLENLQALGVNIQQMRGQGYDGASYMSGKQMGVQARIQAIVARAVYTYCNAHWLNLDTISSATAERSFSTMRRVKIYLRSTMGTERMFGLALLNIHREREIDLEEVVDVFARQKERQCTYGFVEIKNTGEHAPAPPSMPFAYTENQPSYAPAFHINYNGILVERPSKTSE